MNKQGLDHIIEKNSRPTDVIELSLGEIDIYRKKEYAAKLARQCQEDELVKYLADVGYHEMLKLNYTEIRRQFT